MLAFISKVLIVYEIKVFGLIIATFINHRVKRLSAFIRNASISLNIFTIHLFWLREHTIISFRFFHRTKCQRNYTMCVKSTYLLYFLFHICIKYHSNIIQQIGLYHICTKVYAHFDKPLFYLFQVTITTQGINYMQALYVQLLFI